MMHVTIYHTPACSTSRNVLEIIRGQGIEPEIIEYLRTPLSRADIAELVARMKVPVRSLLRKNAPPYEELGLGDEKWSEGQLMDFMVTHPVLINRPVVVTPRGARLCRPKETVLEIL